MCRRKGSQQAHAVVTELHEHNYSILPDLFSLSVELQAQ